MSRRLPRILAVLVLAILATSTLLAAPTFRAPAAAASSGYRLYWFKDPGGTAFYARWNPCAPIHYRANIWYAGSTPAVRGVALRDLRAALARITAITGVRFVFDGWTWSIPQRVNGSFSRWKSPAPLTIAYAYPGKGKGRSNIVESGYLGEGGFTVTMTSSGGSRWVRKINKGYVVLNASYIRTRSYAPGTRRHKLLLLHELGHAMGLDHYGSTAQVMYPTLVDRRAADYQWGDRSGLARLGVRAGCIR